MGAGDSASQRLELAPQRPHAANDYRNGTQQCAGEQREQHDETAVGSQVMEVEIDRNRCGVKRRERSANQYEDQHHQRVDDSHGQVPETGDQTAIFQNLLRDGFKRFPNAPGTPALPANRQSLPTTADALFTRSRNSLPGLKCGTCLPGSATDSPVLGLRPIRAGRKCSEKLPKPRISIRSPAASARSEEHTSELQSLMRISYAVFCLKKQTTKTNRVQDNT